MDLSPDLLEILVCPEDRSTVRPADAALVSKLNASIAAGKVKNKAGNAVDAAVQGALLRADGKVLYVVRDDIPVMLIEEGILADAIG
jgi:uncharacterized protein YbaR (Trm112 family)